MRGGLRASTRHGPALAGGWRRAAAPEPRLYHPFLGIAERLRREERPWRSPEPLEAIGVRAMAGIPRGGPLVALHSNLGPEHTFVHPEGGRFSALIDFGDAYIGHPAFDLRHWSGLADRDAIWRGYAAGEPVGEGLAAVWRALQILADVGAVASGGDGAAAAEEDLRRLLAAV